MVALLFPGQGAQKVGMGKELFERSAAARRVFREVDRALDEELSRLCFEGPEERLRLTANTQPAIMAVSAAAFAALEEAGADFSPVRFIAGHSLGEYSALVAAGALSPGDAARILRKRGEFMQEAVPVGEGAMAAILGADAETVAHACGECAASGEVLEAVNFNSSGQTVVAGHLSAVERLRDRAADWGLRRVVLLPVSAPFHSSLMAPAAERLKPHLEDLDLRPPRWPVVSNVDAVPRTDPDDIRRALILQVDHPVRWADIMRVLDREGVRRALEIGPGNTLQGLARREFRHWTLAGLDSAETLHRSMEVLACSD